MYIEYTQCTRLYKGKGTNLSEAMHLDACLAPGELVPQAAKSCMSTEPEVLMVTRSISAGAARLWNELPQHFMALEDNEFFKREMKTLLFGNSYGE
jgi:hypothetical protein